MWRIMQVAVAPLSAAACACGGKTLAHDKMLISALSLPAALGYNEGQKRSLIRRPLAVLFDGKCVVHDFCLVGTSVNGVPRNGNERFGSNPATNQNRHISTKIVEMLVVKLITWAWQ